MNSNKLNIFFVVATSRLRKEKRASLLCRLPFNKTRKTFSTGQFVNPKNWDSKKQLVKPPEPNLHTINTQLSLFAKNGNMAHAPRQLYPQCYWLGY